MQRASFIKLTVNNNLIPKNHHDSQAMRTIRCLSSTKTQISLREWRRHTHVNTTQKRNVHSKNIHTIANQRTELDLKVSTTAVKEQQKRVLSGHWKDPSNQKKFFDNLAKQLGIQTLDDWYQKLSIDVIQKSGGGGLLSSHNDSPSASLMAAYPEHNWVPWKFNNVPLGFWNSKENQRKYFDWLGKELGINQLDDWYQNLSTEVLQSNGGRTLLSKHGDSAMAALMAVYPEHTWIPWKFKSVQIGYWKSKEHQKQFFDSLWTEMGIQRPEDWYTKLSSKAISEHGGSGLLFQYKNSPMAALMALYPEHTWIPWKFDNVPTGFWKSKENQRKFFDWLGKELGVESLDDWYQKLSTESAQKHGGRTLLLQYNGSPMAALMAAYPEHNWIPWKFSFVPRSFWRDPSNQKKFFDDLGTSLGVQTLDDWYEKLSYDAVLQHGGSGLLRIPQCNSSPVFALMAAYPEHNWATWKFNWAPKGVWKSQENIGRFLLELSEKLSIQTLDDWYRVDWVLLRKFGALTLRKQYGNLYNLLKEQYPHHPWDPKRFQQVGKKTQRWLAVTLKKIFPNEGKDASQLHIDSKQKY